MMFAVWSWQEGIWVMLRAFPQEPHAEAYAYRVRLARYHAKIAPFYPDAWSVEDILRREG